MLTSEARHAGCWAVRVRRLTSRTSRNPRHFERVTVARRPEDSDVH
jgi:hypothetical protein